MTITEFEWNEQQEIILKKWAEIASCYSMDARPGLQDLS